MPSIVGLALAFATIVLLTATLIFNLFFLTILLHDDSGVASLAVLAAVLDLVELSWLVYAFIGLFRSQQSARHRWTAISHYWVLLLLSALTTVLSLALLIVLQAERYTPSSTYAISWHSSLYAAWALLASYVVSHVLYLLWIWPRRIALGADNLSHQSSSSSRSMYKTPRAILMQNMSPMVRSPDTPDQNHQPHFDTSARSSMQGVLHSSSSRTRLVQSPESPTSPLAKFTSWTSQDSSLTAGVQSRGSSIHRSGYPARPTTPVQQKHTTLETIPGSTANSPGRPLDIAAARESPTRQRDDDDDTPRQSFEYATDESRVPPRFRKNSNHTRPSSPITISESHIHPLFRSDSPLPPPTPTLQTTVTASAFGGRTLSYEDLRRAQSRNASRRTSEAKSVHESLAPRSRRGSLTKPISRAVSGAEEWDEDSPLRRRAKSLEDMRARSTLSVADDEVPPLPSPLLIPGADALIGTTEGLALMGAPSQRDQPIGPA